MNRGEVCSPSDAFIQRPFVDLHPKVMGSALVTHPLSRLWGMTSPSLQSQTLPIAQLIWVAVVTAISIVLLWAIEGMPSICPAVYPAPPSCAADARTGPAVWGTAIIATVFVVALFATFMVRPTRRKAVLSWMCVVLAAAALGAIGVTLFSSGFAIGI